MNAPQLKRVLPRNKYVLVAAGALALFLLFRMRSRASTSTDTTGLIGTPLVPGAGDGSFAAVPSTSDGAALDTISSTNGELAAAQASALQDLQTQLGTLNTGLANLGEHFNDPGYWGVDASGAGAGGGGTGSGVETITLPNGDVVLVDIYGNITRIPGGGLAPGTQGGGGGAGDQRQVSIYSQHREEIKAILRDRGPSGQTTAAAPGNRKAGQYGTFSSSDTPSPRKQQQPVALLARRATAGRALTDRAPQLVTPPRYSVVAAHPAGLPVRAMSFLPSSVGAHAPSSGVAVRSIVGVPVAPVIPGAANRVSSGSRVVRFV